MKKSIMLLKIKTPPPSITVINDLPDADLTVTLNTGDDVVPVNSKKVYLNSEFAYISMGGTPYGEVTYENMDVIIGRPVISRRYVIKDPTKNALFRWYF